jgi:hypothetical protein
MWAVDFLLVMLVAFAAFSIIFDFLAKIKMKPALHLCSAVFSCAFALTGFFLFDVADSLIYILSFVALVNMCSSVFCYVARVK